MTDYNLLEAKKVLVLAPHPDDETLGCGGTIARLTSAGAEVHLVVVSDGGKISLPPGDKHTDIIEVRKKESEEAAKVLGIQQTHFLGYPDGELRGFSDKIGRDILHIIERFKPEILLSPSPLDHHDDHIAVSKVAEGLARRHGKIRLGFYQVYGTLRFNSFVDITDFIDVKESAILRYHSSLFCDPALFVEAEKGINRFWSFYMQKRGYYEVFFIVPDLAGPTGSEIIDWLTYYEKKEDPAEIFLSQLKAVDELLFESERSQERIAEMELETEKLKAEAGRREKIVSGMKAEIDTKTDLLNVTALHLDEARRKIDMFEKSIFWKLAMKFYRVRDVLMPAGTIRRRFYDDLLYRFKNNVKH